jgi:phage shock protein E
MLGTMKPVVRALLTTLMPVLLVGALVSCSEDEPSAASGSAVVPVAQAEEAIAEGVTVIDVRTPQEYASGHLPEAVNLDVSAPDFDQRVADLDPAGSYVVYCRTGSRSTAAAEIMLDSGIDDVVNAGGYDDLVSSGLG